MNNDPDLDLAAYPADRIRQLAEPADFGTITVSYPPRPGEPAGIDLVALVGPGAPCHCGADSIARVGAKGQTPVCIQCLAGLLRTARAIGDNLADVPPTDNRWESVRWLDRRHPVIRQLAMRIPGAIDIDGDVDPDAIAAAFVVYDRWKDHDFAHVLPEAAELVGGVPCELPADRIGDHPHSECEAASGTAAPGALTRMSGSERGRLRLVAAFGAAGARLSVLDISGFDQNGRRLLADWLAAVHAF